MAIDYEAMIPGGGEMGALIRAYDWSSTSVGAIENWSPSLETAVSIMLGSRFPMFIWWGKNELINFYNDAYIPVLGARHPQALGMPASQIWADVWDVVSPQTDNVLQAGQATWNENLLLITERNGYLEETYFTFSYSPIFDRGNIAGIFCACTEDTHRVLSDRRLNTLRELAAETVKTKTVEDAVEAAIETIENNPQDLPFALLYLLDETETKAQLSSATKSIQGMSICPAEVDLEDDSNNLWSLKKVMLKSQNQILDLTNSKYDRLPSGAWSESPRLAMVLPLIGSTETFYGWLIVGVSPVREFDDDYQDFFNLIAGQITTAIANANAYQAERERAEALAEINRAKTTFFSNVSHEFRTPLTLMLSPLEDALADTEAPLPFSQLQRIEVVRRNSMRLLKLVNTLLDFSRIEAGRIQATYEPTDLATLTAELASIFRAAIEQALLDLVVDCPTLPEDVFVDRDLWEKIVLNLISNAFKFTFSGSITVRLRSQETQVKLTVEDTGIGIPADEIPRLFDRFYRVEGSRGRTIEGSGIGLSLVKEVVELHGGTIEVNSTVGKGSCFTVAIPIGSAHLPSDRIKKSIPKSLMDVLALSLSTSLYVQEVSSLSNVSDKTQPQIASSPLLRSSATKTARILLADDNADMRDYLTRLLSSYYKIDAVADGVAALNSVRANSPDLVLSDVMMPRMDGFELLRSLRADPDTQEIPIVLLSARAGEESRIEGLEAGADDYLIKPFSTRELLARIEGTLKLAKLRKTAQALRLQSEIAEANLQNVLTSLRDGFLTLDRNWCYTYINDRQLEIIAKTREEVIDKNVWHLFPDLVGTEFYDRAEQVMLSRIPLQFEYYYPTWDRWFENRIYPISDGIAILCAEISDRKQIEQEREQLLARETAARVKAEDLNRLKDEFLAIVSHELRTPLNPILGWSQLLVKGKLSSEHQSKGIATIERNARLQAQLIEDLLDVSSILRGQVKLNLIAIDLESIIEAAISTVQLTADAKSIQIITNLEHSIGKVWGDTRRLQQIVWNLLSNAIKFTPENGQITIELRKIEQSAQMQVKDTGKGIDAEFLPFVFDRFRQEDSALTRNFGGLGLGLAIVRYLTELHQGSIAVASSGKGQGAIFTVTLPLRNTGTTKLDSDETPSNNRSRSKQLNGLRVLAIDDEADSLDLLASVLLQYGAEATTASSAKEAMLALERSTFDLIVSDLGMPVVDGCELIRQIRTRHSIAKIPAIALTAYAAESDRAMAIEAGFQEYVAKPLNVDTLITVCLKVVGSR